MTNLAMQPESRKHGKLFAAKQRKRSYSFASWKRLGGLCLLIVAAECNRDRDSIVDTGKADTSALIRIECPGEPTATLMKRFGRLWSSKTGNRIEIQTYEPSKGPSAESDLWVIEAAQMPHYA